ncbi:MAG TPA: arabinofuranosyltransferase [Micromonosporaceae bacterium]
MAARLRGPGAAAVLVWLVATPVAFLLPELVALDPFTTRAAALPISVALWLVAALFLVAIRWSGEVLAGVAAGLAAAWCALMFRSALYGTPFGFGGFTGDMVRITAAATRYTTTIASSDTLVPSLPAEYPPLYAWLIGRAAVLLDVPAWRLVADFQVLFTSAALLVSFLLWRRLVDGWVALAISALALVTWTDPVKAYEVLTLVIFVPWALEVFARPPRARMHWLPAGLLGGLITVTYQAWIVYAGLGLVALVALTWRSEPDRWAYLRRLGLVAAVAFLVSSWYVIPFLWGMATRGGQQISDLYDSPSLNQGLFPFLDGEPIGLLQLIGLVGLVWLWRSTWWARPLLVMIIGVYGYRLVSMIRFAVTGHTGFLHYTVRLSGLLLTIAGVLVLAHLAPIVLRRLRLTAPRLAASAVLVVTLAWTATTLTLAWMPSTLGSLPATTKVAVAAHAEPLPGGGYPKYAPDQGRAWLPVAPIQQAVEGVLGPDARPVTLSIDERLFAYLPWRGYVAVDPLVSSTLSRFPDRYAEIQRLTSITDPAAFADASGNTRFGPIDVFVLSKRTDGWAWRDQRFSRAQFAPRYWAVVDDLPTGIVVAVRR